MKKTPNAFYFLSYIILTFVIFMAFSIPELYVFLKLEPFSWQNSWDKCTYFSYQGALGLRNTPGTFLLWLIKWGQELGMAGSTQMLIYDLLLPFLSVFFLYKACKELQLNKSIALAYATIILFSSILFNFGNPHITAHFSLTTHFDFFLIGMENYPSILRAPNPQFSYFLLSLCIYLTARYKKITFLLLPIPFLYYFVLIPYVYFLIILFVLLKTNLVRTNFSLLMLHLFVFLCLASGIWCMFTLMGHSLDFIKSATTIFQLGRHPHLNLVGCVGIVIYGLFALLGLVKNNDRLSYFLLSLILCSFAVTNMQLINTFGLDLKDFQDYSNSIIGGLLLVTSMQILATSEPQLRYASAKFRKFIPETMSHLFNLMTTKLGLRGKSLGQSLQHAGCFILLMFIARYTLLSQGFNFKTYNFTINLGATITAEQWKKIKDDPLHAIVLDERLSEFLPFSSPKMLAPVFSYQYRYPFFEKGCSYNPVLAKNAVEFVQNNCDKATMDCQALQERIDAYFQILSESKNIPYRDQAYCEASLYSKNTFYFIQPQKELTVTVPKWN